MRKLLWSLLVINGFLAAAIGGLGYLASAHPLQPGDFLYGAQATAEQIQLRMTTGAVAQADQAIALAERSLADLANAKRMQIPEALSRFDAALTTAEAACAAVPPADSGAVDQRLLVLRQDARDAVSLLLPLPDAVALSERLAPVAEPESIAASPDSPPVIWPAPAVRPERVPFLEETVDHSCYALLGGHADAACEACHTHGAYVGTTQVCADCHSLLPSRLALVNLLPAASEVGKPRASQVYPAHFGDDCQRCHTTVDWKPYAFDHVGILDCRSCHFGEVLPAHSVAPCTACHEDTLDWTNADFDHSETTACFDCHEADAPPRRAAAECRDCHEAESWSAALYFHLLGSRHGLCTRETGRDPHYAGDCAVCHVADNWATITFDHSDLVDCEACHAFEAPPSQAWTSHYKGQCDRCHVLDAWDDVTFDHSGLGQCADCHADEVARSHYPRLACAACHTVRESGRDHLRACGGEHLRDVPSGA